MFGGTGFSAVASNTTYPSPPDKPIGLIAITISKSQIDLVWNDLLDETSYKLFRSVVNDITRANEIANLSASKTNYSDTGLEPDTTYYYWVKAYNKGGASDYSDVAYATTKPMFPPVWAVFPTYFNPARHGKAIIYFAGLTPEVDVYIYGIAGNIVRTWKDVTGRRYVEWYGKNDNDQEISAGIYIVYIKGKNKGKNISEKIKMILIK